MLLDSQYCFQPCEVSLQNEYSSLHPQWVLLNPSLHCFSDGKDKWLSFVRTLGPATWAETFQTLANCDVKIFTGLSRGHLPLPLQRKAMVLFSHIGRILLHSTLTTFGNKKKTAWRTPAACLVPSAQCSPQGLHKINEIYGVLSPGDICLL